MHPGKKLRKALAGKGLITAPGVYDMISAKIADRLGFTTLYMTGFGVSATLGMPDAGLASYTEMVESVAQICQGTSTPVICDGDTGFGGLLNVERTVQGYERAGAAAIQLEDQVFPKRCGHLAGKDVIDVAQFALALQAAVETRRDPDTVIIARTDARAPLGIEEAIRRANRYASVGADVIFVEAPQSVEEIEQIAAEVDAPLLLNVVPGGRTPELPHPRLAELGYRIVIHPGVALAAVVPAMIGALSTLRETTPSRDGAPSPESFFDLFDLGEWNELGPRYDCRTTAVTVCSR